MENKSKVIIVTVVVLVIVAGAGFWFWSKKKAAPSAPSVQQEVPSEPYSQEKVTEGLGGNIYEKSQNPISDKLPTTNPYEADTNPFGGKTNPYEDTYKNPFE